MKVDILAFGAHPDDVEMGCGGTIAKSTSMDLYFDICVFSKCKCTTMD